MAYLPPARVKDFDRSAKRSELYETWHQKVTTEIAKYSAFPRFLDPLAVNETAIRAVIPWSGFPRIFDSWLDVENHEERRAQAYRSAEILSRTTYVSFEDQLFEIPADIGAGLALFPEINGVPSIEDAFTITERPQDEYLEWHVVKDQVTGRVVRIDFTVEAPEYWEVLAEGDPALVQQIYTELLGVEVPQKDLFFKGDVLCPKLERVGEGFRIAGHVSIASDDPEMPKFRKGQYNRWNKWNTDLGAVHLTQRNNTLFAEINLAARATSRFSVRKDLASTADRFELVACGGYGGINRNSDPTIGFEVNSLALSNLRAMVSNPIGLYVGEVDLGAFRDPNGHPVARDKILTIAKTNDVPRGSFRDDDGLARVLRFSVHPPEGADYGLDQCTFDGHALTTGGPIARKTSVVIHGIAMPSNVSNPVRECIARACAHPEKLPVYYLTVPPGEPCPVIGDAVWQEPPVTVAPEAGGLLSSNVLQAMTPRRAFVSRG